MDASRIDLLQRMPVFGALTERTLQVLAEKSRRLEVAAGDYFFREGDAAL